MKQLTITNPTTATGIALLVLRAGIAALMLTHGIPKLQALFSGNIQFPGIFGMSPGISLSLAVFSEVACSLLLLFGLGTRLATIPLIITMLVAVFFVHAADPFAKQEAGLLYLVPYVVLLISGAGKYSVDHLLEMQALKKVPGMKPVNKTLVPVFQKARQ